MKNFIFLLLTFMLITSCSIDEDETATYDEFYGELSAHVPDEGCDVIIVANFGDYGQLHITNDNDNLFITVEANEGLALENIKLHIANDYSEFPTVGKGNLPPGQMEINEDLDPVVTYKNYEFSLADYNLEDDNIVIAAKVNFTDGSEYFSAWAGDIPGAQGNWFYLEYTVQQCPITEDPCENFYPNVERELCSSQVNNISLLGVTNYFKNQVFLNTNLSTITGTFTPNMQELLALIQEGGPVGEYRTVYTVDTPECGLVSFEIVARVSDCN